MVAKVLRTKNFQKKFQRYPREQERIEKTINMLQKDESYRSLHTHGLCKVGDMEIKECYVSSKMRILYTKHCNILYLLDIGCHDIIKQVSHKGKYRNIAHLL